MLLNDVNMLLKIILRMSCADLTMYSKSIWWCIIYFFIYYS